MEAERPGPAGPVTPDTRPIYQLRIALRGVKPAIWRRVQVPADISLPRLHRVFQVAMGWTDSHLHEFKIGGRPFGLPSADWGGYYAFPEHSVRLWQVVARPNMRFTYSYDFGDSWEHEVRVEKILPPEPGVHYPRGLAGARACPPEDCGGVNGYAELLEAIRDPGHDRHAELLEWLGGGFDPEAFDLDAVNRRLRRFRGSRDGA
jgi:hypothetical protein